MDIVVNSDALYGKFQSISSKSDFVRLLLCSLFSTKPTLIQSNNMCDDVISAINAAKNMGAEVVKMDDENLAVCNGDKIRNNVEINCGESATLLRFLMPCANYFCKTVRFRAESSLISRPIVDFVDILSEHGLTFSNNVLPFEVSGHIQSGDYFIPGNISSQFISGLLFILPVLKGSSRIVITTPLQSEKYVDLTIKRLKDFGIVVDKRDREIFICGGQKYNSMGRYITEGDWSYAANVLSLGAVSGEVCMSGLDIDSVQPDRCIIDFFNDMGVNVQHSSEGIIVKKSRFGGIVTDLSGCPDLFPVMAVLSSCAEGKSFFYGTERLIYKESNRLYSVSSMLNGLGADISYSMNGVKVNPVEKLCGGTVHSFGDHRVVMAAAVASKLCSSNVKILGADCVKKSAPDFLKVLDSCIKGG